MNFNDVIPRFYYRQAPSILREPKKGKEEENIIGLELEFNNVMNKDCDNCCCMDCDYCHEDGEWTIPYEVQEAFEELFKKGIIINPENRELIKDDNNAFIERDSSVDGEIILQADYQRNIMKKVNKIHKYLNDEIIDNGSNTSCHIHRNYEFLKKFGISRNDYQKIHEFLGPVLYKISGRQKNSYQNWCHSRFFSYNNDFDIEFTNMLKMAELVDKVTDYYPDKYLICNCDKSNSLETRIFSNVHNFDPKYVKLYIDFTNLCIDLSQYMNGKSYVKEFDTLIDWVNEFCNKIQSRRRILKQFNLQDYIVKEQDIKFVDLNNKWTQIYNKLEMIEGMYYSYSDQTMSLIRFVRDHNIEVGKIKLFETPKFEEIKQQLGVQYNEEYENL